MNKKRILGIILCFCICSVFFADTSAAASEMPASEEAISGEENLQQAIPEEDMTEEIMTEEDMTEAAAGTDNADAVFGGDLEYSMEDREIWSIDEQGNVFIVEDEGDGVIEESESELQMLSGEKIVNFRATSSGSAVRTTTEYTEYKTGAVGYTYGGSGADAAYLGTENGKVKFMQSGVVGMVDASKVQVVNLSSAKSYSNYYANGTRIIHRICMDMTTPGYSGSVDVGPQQSYMTAGATYYSYDGHYFYTSYGTMLSDYMNETRRNSINPDQPYYNYFQYLPFRGKSNYSASEMKAIVNGRVKSGSKMRNTGDLFINHQNTYGANALLMIGIGANESGWGTSSIAMNKNNLFGLNAVDTSPGASANTFSSVSACIKDFAETYLSKRYLRAGYMFYNGGYCGDKASGINVRYASDPYWGEKAAAIAWSIDNANGKKDQGQYTVGIKDRIATSHTNLNVRKEATAASAALYNTGTVSNYAFLILEDAGDFYKVQSDPVLAGGRGQIDANVGTYDSNAMYAYVSKDYVQPVTGKAPGQSMLAYDVHVQSYGWRENIAGGSIAGTSGESKRLEALKVRLNNPDYSGSVQYQSHIQTYGWQDWKSDGELSGTKGQSKRLEAVRIRLTGEMEKQYDIYYRVHAQTYGWLDWAKNGDIAGSTDAAKRLEAVQIQLVKKGGAAPGNMTKPYVQPLLQYRTHVQSYGWQDYTLGGGNSGTTGSAKRLEGIQIQLNNPKYSGSIEYKVHVQTYGWQDWKKDNAMAGTTGQSKRLEAIQIRLTGEMEQKYDVYYRVHAQTYGWLDWAKNGEAAGSEGLAKRLEAIQIVLTAKGGEAPGSMERPMIRE